MSLRAGAVLGALLIGSLGRPLMAGPFGGTEDFDNFGKQLNFCLVVSGGGVCAAVAAINSFIFLENQYPTIYRLNLTPNIEGAKPNQTDYSDAVLFGTALYGLPGGLPDSITGWDNYVTAKQSWFTQYAPNTTFITSNYPGSKQNDGIPTLAFLGGEMADKEDVEVFVSGALGAHAITVTSITCPDPATCIIKYQDPNAPTVQQTSQLFTSPDGHLEFQGLPGSGDNFNFYTIDAAFSESPIPEPASILLLATGMAGILTKAVRRRARQPAGFWG